VLSLNIAYFPIGINSIERITPASHHIKGRASALFLKRVYTKMTSKQPFISHFLLFDPQIEAISNGREAHELWVKLDSHERFIDFVLEHENFS
jgi:hypothetical protein